MNFIKRYLGRLSNAPTASNIQSGTNPWNVDKPMSYSGMWLGTTIVQRHINKKMSGAEKVSWLEYSLRGHLGEKLRSASSRCLILGANEGWIERYLRANGFLCQILATDIADRALERASKASAALGYENIEYRVADLNVSIFEGLFDCIIAEGVLHHIEKTEPLLPRLHDNLTEDGMLVGVEYEGPFRFQLSDLQVAWINAAALGLSSSRSSARLQRAC